MNDKLYIIMCPPFSTYPIQPNDISAASLIDCPHCKLSMWLSEKKKSILEKAKESKNDFLLICFNCLEKKFIKKEINIEETSILNI